MKTLIFRSSFFTKILFATYLGLALISQLVANQTLLLNDKSANSLSLGGGSDLLSTDSALSRTYSGIFALKDKSEFSFVHNGILGSLSDIATENLILGYKKPIYGPIRLGTYLKYHNLGSFEVRDSRGRIDSRIEPTVLLIGVPVIFDVETLIFSDRIVTNGGEEVSTKSLTEILLKKIKAGVNINYFSSKLTEDYQAWSLFADINLSAGFSIPYLGMSEPLISRVDLERRKTKEKTGIEIALSVQIQKELESKDPDSLKPMKIDAYSNELKKQIEVVEKIYLKRDRDIETLPSVRKNLYQIYYASQDEITQEIVSNLINIATKEYTEIVSIASNALMENFRINRNRIGDDLVQNKADTEDFIKKLTELISLKTSTNVAANTAVIELVKKFTNEFELFLKEEIENAKVFLAASGSANMFREPKPVVVYLVKRNDTWESIAKSFYGSELEKERILTFNNINVAKMRRPLANTEINIPPLPEPEPEKVTKEGSEIDLNDFIKGAVLKQNAFIAQKKKELDLSLKPYTGHINTLFAKAILNGLIKRTELIHQRSAIVLETKNKLESLQALLLREKRDIVSKSQLAMRDVNKLKLKKNLDYLFIQKSSEASTVFNEYKKGERKIFLRLLNDIYLAKKAILKNLQNDQIERNKISLAENSDIYERRRDILKINNAMTISELGNSSDNAAKVIDENSKFQAAMAEILFEEAIAMRAINNNLKWKLSEYEWELYLTELIYVSSEEKKNTVAVGFSAMNLGIPIKYVGTSESLPVEVRIDFNYKYLYNDFIGSTLFLHAGYNRVFGGQAGIGISGTYIENYDIKLGLYFDSAGVIFGGGVGMRFDMGLMNYRMEGGFRYQQGIGSSYSAGLGLLF